ncbi:MAG TPA: APC family permease [Bryobacteraceae bacterium]|jgi:amino acid transporter|nr:APC family permease [Bryobacteraceae bacterium]
MPDPVAAEPQLERELGLRDLVLFLIPCVCGPRWLAYAASAGSGTVTLWLGTALIFVAPLGIAVAALMTKYPGAGGLYVWAREDFGPWHGFLAFFTYWISIAFTLPSAAVIAMSVGVFTLGPSYAYLADSRTFLLCASLAAIWIALGTNIVGLKIGKWTENLGGLATAVLGGLLIVIAALVWARRGPASSLNPLPDWNWHTLQTWSVISFALSGLEVAGLMGGEIRKPERTVVPAAWISSLFAALFYIVCTLALLVLLKPSAISELHGLGDAGAAAASVLGTAWLPAAIAVLVLLNAVGAFGGLGSSVSRMPYAAGVDRLLPAAFGRVHPRWRTPHVSLLTLGAVATVLLIGVQAGDTFKAAVQAMVSLMVIAGFIPYLYIFASAWKAGRKVAAVSGQLATLITLACSIVPGQDVTNVWLFELKIFGGTFAVIALAWFVYRLNRPVPTPAA